MSQGALHFEALLTTQNFERGMDRLRNDIRSAAGLFKNLALGISSYFSAQALMGFGRELINVRGEFQKTEIAFGTMLGSSEKAKTLMGQMVDLAAKTPFSLQDVSSGAKQLLAFQVPAKDIVDTLTRMGNIAAGLSVPLERVNMVYGQVKAKGRLQGDDLKQFTEMGIPMIHELANSLGKADSEINKMVSDGKVGFSDVKKVLFNLTNEGGMFYNLMEAQSKTLSGQVSNLGDAWDQMLNKIGQSNEGILSGGIQEAAYLIENYQQVLEQIEVLVAAYGAYKAAIIVTATAQEYSAKTVQSEIALLGISEKMKLGRALVTQRQAVASLEEARAEQVSIQAKYASLQAEVALLSVKRQKLLAIATEKTAAAQTAALQLNLAQRELASLTATATAREINIATKNVEKAQNEVLATQEMASVARKNALTASSQFYTVQKELENTAVAQGNVAKAVETAEDVANTAAKEANAVATTQLTIVQRAQVLVSNLAAKGQALLNSTILANPYAIAIALLAVLAAAIYKYSTSLSDAEQLQKELNGEINNQNSSIEENKSKIDALVKAIKSQNATDNERAGWLKQIKTLSNGRLDQLTVEEIRTGKATAAIAKYIEMLKLEAKAKVLAQNNAELDKKRKEVLDKIDGGFGVHDMWDDLTDFDSGFHGGNLAARKQERLSRQRDAIDEQKKANDAELENLAKSGVKIAEAETNVGNQQVDAIKESKKKTKKEHQQQLAEIVPQESIIALERRVENWNAALQRMRTDKDGSKVVDVLTQDKYGKQVKTGETIGLNEALKRAQQDEEKLAAARKEIQIKSFDEQVSEMQRQFEVRDKLLEKGIPKESVDDMFPALKDQNILVNLRQMRRELTELAESGNGTEQTANNLFKISEVVDKMEGKESVLDKFTKSLDKGKLGKSSQEYLDWLSTQKVTDPESNTALGAAKNNAVTERWRAEKAEMDRQYSQFLQDHKSFEDVKTEITRDAAQNRAMIEADENLTPEAKEHYLSESQMQEMQAKARLAADFVRNLPLWDEISSSLDNHMIVNVDKLIDELQRKIKEKGKDMNPVDLRSALNELKKMKQRVSEENPFLGLKMSFEDLISTINEETDGTASGSVEKFGRVAESVGSVTDSLGKVLDALGPVREYMSESANETIDNIQAMLQFGKGATEAMSSTANAVSQALKSGTWSNWITAIIQIIYMVIKAIVSLVTWMSKVHDKKLQKQINEHKAAVDNLKIAYDELGDSLRKALGDDTRQLQMQQIKNLQEQNREIEKMRKAEDDKKKTDKQKIADYDGQMRDNKQKIADLHDEIIRNILQTDAKDAASKLGDALVDAFSKGEDASKSMRDVANSMIQDIVKNALKLRMEKAMQPVMDNLLATMGFDKDGNGSFMGLAPAQIEAFKAQIAAIGQQQQGFLDAYQQLFQTDSAAAQGLKGDIKGVSEKTAGALEAQINAMRVNQVSGLEVMRSSLLQLSQIEFNTRRLLNMDKNLQELNQKTKPSLAGF